MLVQTCHLFDHLVGAGDQVVGNHRKGVRLVHDTGVLRYLGGAACPRSVGGAAMTYVSLRAQLSPAPGAV
jgi:hypothetical protein